MRSFFPRQGGKSRLAEVILKYFPKDYDVYVEPFIGAGSVFLMQKADVEPRVTEAVRSARARLEIINDKDKDISDIWRDIKKVKVEDVQYYDFKLSDARFKELMDSSPKNPVDRLFRNLYLSFNSYAGKRNHLNKRRGGGKTFLQRLPEIKERLKDTVVL